jgi:alginate O-acetyltransferase complex protein AlgI
MLFNSLEFFLFLFLTWNLHRVSPVRFQNLLLLTTSYFFYAWWDIRFLFLVILSTCIDYIAGLVMGGGSPAPAEARRTASFLLLGATACLVAPWLRTGPLTGWQGVALSLTLLFTVFLTFLPFLLKRWAPIKRREWALGASLTGNLAILAVFKYYNFFVSSAEEALLSLGLGPLGWNLDIILPLGISFYTFQSMSYSWDIYRKNLEPRTSLLNFALFVAYFPQIIAGPIERAGTLLPQLERPRTPTTGMLAHGVHLIVLGLFKKVAIADGVARTINQVFSLSGQLSAWTVLLGLTLFAIQILCDFSGYTDIARGVSFLFGISLSQNFRCPYLSKNPREFWTRWHISLSSWLRDYLYIPLGGNRGSRVTIYRNLVVTMVLGGLWHGAAWNYVLWGLFHGCLLCGHRAWTERYGQRHISFLGSAVSSLALVSCVLYGWLLFRCESWEQICSFTLALSSLDTSLAAVQYPQLSAWFGLPAFLCLEYLKYDHDDLIFHSIPAPLRGLLYSLILLSLFLGFSNKSSEFLYFAF